MAGTGAPGHEKADEIPGPAGNTSPQARQNRSTAGIQGGKMGKLSFPERRRTVSGTRTGLRHTAAPRPRPLLHSRVGPDQGGTGGGECRCI